MILDWIGQIAELLSTIVKKAFPTPEETKDARKERAKKNWDKFREQEKKVRNTLYPPGDPPK